MSGREVLTSRVDLPAGLAKILDELAHEWGCNRADAIAFLIAAAARHGATAARREAREARGFSTLFDDLEALCREHRPDVRYSFTRDRDETRRSRSMQGFLISESVDIWQRKKAPAKSSCGMTSHQPGCNCGGAGGDR